MKVELEIPTWYVEILHARALLTRMSITDALLESLDIETPDVTAESVGWARGHGIPVELVASRSHVSRSTVEAADRRFRGSRSRMSA